MTKEKAAELIAKFWSHTLEFQCISSNGAKDKTNMMANMLATIMKMDHIEHDQAKLAKFRDNLAKLILETLEKWGGSYFSFGVDYHPDLILRDACELSDIKCDDMCTFPFKTATIISSDNPVDPNSYVGKVRNGYQAEWVVLEDKLFAEDGHYTGPLNA